MVTENVVDSESKPPSVYLQPYLHSYAESKNNRTAKHYRCDIATTDQLNISLSLSKTFAVGITELVCRASRKLLTLLVGMTYNNARYDYQRRNTCSVTRKIESTVNV